MVEMVGAIAVGGWKTDKRCERRGGGRGRAEEEVESNRGGIERNPEDGWERDRLPRARKGERGEERRRRHTPLEEPEPSDGKTIIVSESQKTTTAIEGAA